MTTMDRLLIVITRPDGQSEIGVLWSVADKTTVGDSMVWVIDGSTTGLPGSRGWTAMLQGITDRPTFSDFLSIGVIYHRQDGKFSDGTNAATDLNASFPGVGDRHNAYSSGGHPERPEYIEHRAMADAIQADPQSENAQALFDHFWLTCFGDPILEDLITLLRAHALAMANGNGKDYVTKEKIESITGYATAAEKAKVAISNLRGEDYTYEAVREALVTAVKEQERQNHNRG